MTLVKKDAELENGTAPSRTVNSKYDNSVVNDLTSLKEF